MVKPEEKAQLAIKIEKILCTELGDDMNMKLQVLDLVAAFIVPGARVVIQRRES